MPILHSPVLLAALCQLAQARAEVEGKEPGWAVSHASVWAVLALSVAPAVCPGRPWGSLPTVTSHPERGSATSCGRTLLPSAPAPAAPREGGKRRPPVHA